MTTVVVSRQRRVSVTTATSSPGISSLNFRLDKLKDVYEPPSPITGSTLVYNSANDTYVVQKLSIENVANVDTIAIDGGTF